MAALDLEDVKIVPKAPSAEELLEAERGEVEVVAKARTRQGVKEVRGIVWWEKTESGVAVFIEGDLLDFVKREDFVRGVEKDKTATGGVVRGWLTTDASVVGSIVTVNTTSLLQAALYKASGLDGVEAEGWGTVTGAGLKVEYRGESSKWYQLYSKIAGVVRALLGLVQPLTEEAKAAEENAERLEGAKGAVKALVDRLLVGGRISVSRAASAGGVGVGEVKVEYALHGRPGEEPWLEVRLFDERGSEIARINVRWDGEGLRGVFAGSKGQAERLASALRLLGAEVEAEERGGEWRVELPTAAVAAVSHPEWQKAVRALVEELYKKGKIDKKERGRLLKIIEAGPIAARAKKAAEDILSPEAAERIDPVEHSAYGRVFYPLVDLLLRDVSEVEFAQFFTTAVFGDGSINPYAVELILGEFGSDKLPYDKFHKLALWLAVVEKYRPVFEKYGVDITPSVYVRKDTIKLRFAPEAAGLLFALGGGPIWRVYDKYVKEVGRNPWDAGFIKAEEMLYLVKEAFKDVKVRWHIDEVGEKPVLRMRFVRKVGGNEVEIASLNVYLKEDVTGKWLHAEFKGSREKAEALASMLRAWGAEAEAKPVGEGWRVDLTMGQLSAVDHPEFKRALEAFVARAREKGLLTEEQAERRAAKLSTGPNAVEIAGVEFHMRPEWKDKEKRVLKQVEIVYQSTDKGQFERAVKALRAFGLVEGADFTARWYEEGRGEIWLRAGVFEKAAEALRGAGLKEGEDYTAQKDKEGGGYIYVKNPKENLKKALEALRNAGLVEGEDYTAVTSEGYVRLAVPEALWTIAWMARHGDKKAKEVLNQLLEVAEKLGIRQYFEERIRPVLAAGSKEAKGKKFTLEEKGITVEITDFKVEWVQLKNTNEPCNWPAELCRPKVTVEYKVGSQVQTLTVTWNVGDKREVRAGVEIKTIHKAAALIAVGVREGDEKEKERVVKIAERGGTVSLTLDNLVAMAEYNKDLLEWVVRVRRTKGVGKGNKGLN